MGTLENRSALGATAVEVDDLRRDFQIIMKSTLVIRKLKIH